MFYVSAIMC